MTIRISPRPGDWDVDLMALYDECLPPFMFVATLDGQTDVRLIADEIADRISDPEVCPVLPDYSVFHAHHLPSFLQPGLPIFSGPCAVWFLEFCNGPLLDPPYDWSQLLLGEIIEPEKFETELDATEVWMAANGILGGVIKANSLLSLRLGH